MHSAQDNTCRCRCSVRCLFSWNMKQWLCILFYQWVHTET